VTILAIGVWAAALLLLPGWALWRLVGPRGLPWLLVVAPAFGLSLCLLSLAAWAAYITGVGFDGLRISAVALVALAVIGLAASFVVRRGGSRFPETVPTWTLWAAAAVAVAAVLSALYSGTWMSLTADTFYHLAAIRSVLEHNTALPREVFFSTPVPAPDPTTGAWHSALAVVASLAGADPIDVWRAMTVAAAPMTALAFFALALAVTRNGAAAAIATGLYVVLALGLDFRSAANTNRFGPFLGWLALAFALRYMDTGSRRELAVGAPIAFAASAVHPAQSPFLLATLGCAALAALVIRSDRLKEVALASALVGAATIPLLAVNFLTLAASTPYAAMAQTAPLPLRVAHRPWTWVLPTFWYRTSGIVLGTLFAPLFLRPWRNGDFRAGMLVVLLLAIPLVSLTPLFATSYSNQYLLARVADVLQPLAWIAWAWSMAIAAGSLRGRLVLPAAAVLLVSVSAAAVGFYAGPWQHFSLQPGPIPAFATTRTTDLTVAWKDRLDAVAKLPPHSVILAAPDMGFELSGLTGREVVAVLQSHTPHQIEVRDGARRREDALDFVEGRLSPVAMAGVIEHYGVTDVLVDTDRTDPQAWDLIESAQILTPVAGNSTWRLYRYDPTKLASFLDLTDSVGPEHVLAGRAVFAQMGAGNPVTGTVRLEATGPGGTFSRDLAVNGQTLALPVPLDSPLGTYHLTVATPGGPSRVLGDFTVGRLFQAEDLGGVAPGRAQGWTTQGGPIYHGALAAAATDVGASAEQRTPPLAAGVYCVTATVFDYGTGDANELEVGAKGSAGADVSWAGATAGPRDVTASMTVDEPSDMLVMRVVSRGQPRVVVDQLQLYPRAGGACP